MLRNDTLQTDKIVPRGALVNEFWKAKHNTINVSRTTFHQISWNSTFISGVTLLLSPE